MIKIDLTSKGDGAAVDRSEFENELTRLYLAIGAQSAYTKIDDSGRRTDGLVVEISDAREIESKAKMIFEVLKVRPTFLPEGARRDDFGF